MQAEVIDETFSTIWEADDEEDLVEKLQQQQDSASILSITTRS